MLEKGNIENYEILEYDNLLVYRKLSYSIIKKKEMFDIKK